MNKLFLSLIFFYIFSALCYADENKKESACISPSFEKKGECWDILKVTEDCQIKPIIMELEDQSIYCPRKKVTQLVKTEVNKINIEKAFNKKLKKLATKNINEEIDAVVAMHSYYLLGYKLPSGNYKIPGISKIEYGENTCRIVMLEGFERVTIYSKEHILYLESMYQYAEKFNQALIEYCKN